MKFVDEVKIRVKAGRGGRGCVSFRREKFVPKGGPNGGDGGKGGDIIIRANGQLLTLLDLSYQKYYRSEDGRHGKGGRKKGKDALDLTIKIPVGTLVRDRETNEVLKDLDKEGEWVIVARGGKGGRGNAQFATSTNQSPKYAEDGQPGEEHWLDLELKLLADVGVIGLPNSGKSTLVSKISAAHPKIADYPFTTLIPQLGVVRFPDNEESFTVADIPGLIRGAHQGTGLGIKFLRHLERTTFLLHLIDISPTAYYGPLEGYEIINQELGFYNPSLLNRPQIIVISKIDLPEVKEKLPLVREQFREKGREIFPISALSGEGVPCLLKQVIEELSQIKKQGNKR